MKQTLFYLKGVIDNNMITWRDFNTHVHQWTNNAEQNNEEM